MIVHARCDFCHMSQQKPLFFYFTGVALVAVPRVLLINFFSLNLESALFYDRSAGLNFSFSRILNCDVNLEFCTGR